MRTLRQFGLVGRMLSIQGKLTIISVALMTPLIAVSLFSEQLIRQQLSRIEFALQGGDAIVDIWDYTIETTLSPKELPKPVNLSPSVLSMDGRLSGLQEKLHDPELATHKRIQAAHDAILTISGKSELSNILSSKSPELAMVLFDRGAELVFRLERLASIGIRLSKKNELNQYDIMNVMVAGGQFKNVADNVGRVTRIEPYVFPETARALISHVGADYRKLNSKFQGQAAKIVMGADKHRDGQMLVVEPLVEAEVAFEHGINAYWRAVMTASVDLIHQDRAELTQLYFLVIGGLAVFTVICAGAAIVLRRSIILQTQEIEAAYRATDQQNQELEALRRQAEHESHHDALTGLANRRYLERELDIRVRNARQAAGGIAVLHIDLDRFKMINDTLGHAAGDFVLEHVADVLHRETRSDDVVARIGGDEFLILSYSKGEHEPLSRMVNRIIESLSKPVEFDGNLCQFGASIGVNTATGKELEDFDSGRFLSNADIALYSAKEGGRGRYVFFNKALRAETEASKSLSDELILGLENGEFYPVYQPQVDAQTGEWIGVEALARWEHPEKGGLSPSVFIPIARRLGMLARLDEAIMEQGLKDLTHWDAVGIHVPKLSLNLSEHRLADPAFLDWLETHDLPVGRLSFEVLETVFSDDFDDVRRFAVDRLQELNIALEMDDFGTGHASLAGLLSFSPQRLKIARELAGPVDTSERHARLVSGTVDVAAALEIEVLAEGVERKEQADVLRDLGCQSLQGFYFARPMPANELVKWWRGNMVAKPSRSSHAV